MESGHLTKNLVQRTDSLYESNMGERSRWAASMLRGVASVCADFMRAAIAKNSDTLKKEKESYFSEVEFKAAAYLLLPKLSERMNKPYLEALPPSQMMHGATYSQMQTTLCAALTQDMIADLKLNNYATPSPTFEKPLNNRGLNWSDRMQAREQITTLFNWNKRHQLPQPDKYRTLFQSRHLNDKRIDVELIDKYVSCKLTDFIEITDEILGSIKRQNLRILTRNADNFDAIRRTQYIRGSQPPIQPTLFILEE